MQVSVQVQREKWYPGMMSAQSEVPDRRREEKRESVERHNPAPAPVMQARLLLSRRSVSPSCSAPPCQFGCLGASRRRRWGADCSTESKCSDS
jgi:hypothetical protein